MAPTRALKITTLAAVLAASSTHAAGPHVHGTATMDVALDGDELHLSLSSPMANLVGFEHAPSTETQHATIRDAGESLRGGRLVSLPAAAGCKLESAGVELPHGDEDDHKGRAADHHGHGHKEHDNQYVHSDARANYSFHCAAPGKLTHVDLSALFERFPALERLEVQSVGPGGQSSARLSSGNPRFDF